MTGKLIAPADATISRLNIGNALSGISSPATTVDGDIWISTSNRLAYKSNGNFYTPASISIANAFTSTQIVDVTSASTALRVTQRGTGEALRVEDETTPDATAFVISNTGRVGIGVTPDATVSLSVDTTGIKFGDGTIQTTASIAGATGATGASGSPGGATGAGTDAIFFLNDLIVNTSYSIPVSKNAGTFGPVTVASGVVVTVPPGSVWTVV
jgi:hypothetical protein